MTNKKKSILIILTTIVFIGAIIGAYFGYKALVKGGVSGPETPSIQNRGNYKNFTITDINGNEVKLSDFIGQPIVINFWASWCGPCRSELPHFNKLAKEYEGRVHFLMVNLSGEDKQSVIKFVERNGYTFPLYFDNTDSGANAYSVSSIPVTVFITAEGKIGEQRVGALSESVLRNYITQMIK